MNKRATLIVTAVIALAAVGTAAGLLYARHTPPHAVATAGPKQLWHCGMHPQVIQDHPGDCPICHMELTPLKGGVAADRKPAYWWDPMLGPSSVTNHPGKSAMGMDLVPVYADAKPAGGPDVTVDPRTVQVLGVQTAPVTRGPVHQTIRAVGLFKLAEPGLHDVSLKVGGWVDKLYADQVGLHVHKGDPLFALYSPDLQVAAQELISAVKTRDAAPPAYRTEADGMVASARRKLELWDVDAREIDAIARADRPPRDVTFYSPATGNVEEKAIVQGAAVMPGTMLLRVADHATMWMDAQVYEQQIPLLKLGQPVHVTLDAVPGRTFDGTVTFIYPHLDPMTRTLTVRATFDNPGFVLRPGMFADADVVTEPVADAVRVPKAAVMDTGTRQIVFVDQGGGHYGPQAVRTGVRGDDDLVQITGGLTVGQTVVTSGQFLMDVESRTQEAIADLRGPPTAMAAGTLSQVYCPMSKGTWLQAAGETDNPYMGPAMKTCGTPQAVVPPPPAASPLAPVVASYLAVQKSLAAGHVDAKAAGDLKAAAAAVPTLTRPADALAAAADLAAARESFQAVTTALMPLLQPHADR